MASKLYGVNATIIIFIMFVLYCIETLPMNPNRNACKKAVQSLYKAAFTAGNNGNEEEEEEEEDDDHLKRDEVEDEVEDEVDVEEYGSEHGDADDEEDEDDEYFDGDQDYSVNETFIAK